MNLTNTIFNTTPAVIHAHGSHQHKPNWKPIRTAFFNSPKCHFGPCPDLTIITCNNGHQSMGIAEQSLDHLGVPYQVYGQEIETWINSQHKPRVLYQALNQIHTEFTLYLDSRDAIIIDNPQIILERFKNNFDCDLLFGADRINWPNVKEFQKFEHRVNPIKGNDFCYFNGGTWMGRTDFCRLFFEDALNTKPAPEAPESEQGILKQLFPKYHPQVNLDYRCEIFQNIGFVLRDIFKIGDP